MKLDVERICPVCGKTYQANSMRLSFGRQTTCSRPCSYQLRANALANGLLLTCSTCGAEFQRSPARIKHKHEGVYCSRECHYRGRSLGTTRRVVRRKYNRKPVSLEVRRAWARKARATRLERNNYRQGEATRLKLREATVKQLSRQKRHVSKVEDKVAEELQRRGIAFERQVAIRDNGTGRFLACVDFLLPGAIVLEVNGTFFHSDPRTYPDGPRFPVQRRVAQAYGRKVASLAALGYRLVEVWEADVDESVEDALTQALAGKV